MKSRYGTVAVNDFTVGIACCKRSLKSELKYLKKIVQSLYMSGACICQDVGEQFVFSIKMMFSHNKRLIAVDKVLYRKEA